MKGKGKQSSVLAERREDGKLVVKLRPANRKFRALLSIDGGGVRGVIPALVLQGFEQVVKEVFREVCSDYEDLKDEELVVDVRDYFDMVSGNSAGSILALYVVSGGGNPGLYKENGLLEGLEPGSAAGAIAAIESFVEQVFTPRWYARLPPLSYLSGMLYSKYGSTGFVSALETIFGNMLMSSIRQDVYIPAYELDNARPVGFYVRQLTDKESESGYMCPREVSKDDDTDEGCASSNGEPLPFGFHSSGHFDARRLEIPIRVVAQASSSAPVFFHPAHYIKEGLSKEIDVLQDQVKWADGGVVSNNPTMQALSLMSTLYCNRETSDILSIKNMAVLSLGTGCKRQGVKILKKGGFMEWGTDLISALMDAHSWINHQIIDALFDGNLLKKKMVDRYLRINRISKEGCADFHVLGALDSKDKLEDLKEIGRSLARENHEKMKKFVKEVLMAEAPRKQGNRTH